MDYSIKIVTMNEFESVAPYNTLAEALVFGRLYSELTRTKHVDVEINGNMHVRFIRGSATDFGIIA